MTRNLHLINARMFTPWAGPDNASELISLYITDGRAEFGVHGAGLPIDGRADVKTIDCQGYRLSESFVDAHCHVMAYASSLMAVDCSPSAVSSIAGIKDAIRLRADTTPEGQWVRAARYSEFDLDEKRHPTRRDLDEVSPRHPVRLTHRSGHAVVLNSLALKAVGITSTSDEPTGGTIDRDPTTGEPTGLLLEMADLVRDRIPRLSDEELRSAMRLASDKFLSYGITSVCDASPGNSPETYATFGKMQQEGHFLPSVTMMAGAKHLDDFVAASLRMGVGTEHRSISHIKIMLTASGGALSPSPDELTNLINRAHLLRWPVAIHTVEATALQAALNSLQDAAPLQGRNWKDRIEHCSECPPELISKMAALNVAVVSNPAFIYHSGDRFLSQTDPADTRSLYPMKSLDAAGIPLAAGSDAPVADPNPMTGIYGAITRRSEGGEQVNPAEKLSLKQALALYHRNVGGKGEGFFFSGPAHRSGDNGFVLLDGPLNEYEPEEILKTKVVMTIRDGEIVYEA